MNNMNEDRENAPSDMNIMNKNDNEINDTVNNININETLNNAKHPDRQPAANDFAVQNEAQIPFNSAQQSTAEAPSGAAAPIYQNQAVFYNPAVSARKKRKFNISKRDVFFAAVFFAVSLVITDFVLWHGLSLGFSISFALLFATVTAYYGGKIKKSSSFAVCCGFLSIAAAGSFAVCNDIKVKVFMLLPTALLFAVYVRGISCGFSRSTGSFKVLADAAESAFKIPFQNAGAVFGGYFGLSAKNRANKNVVAGLLLAVPVLLVVIPLLASSDAAFENLVKSLFENVATVLGKIIVALLISVLLVVYAVSNKYYKPQKAKSRAVHRAVNPAVSISFLSVISAVYLVFLFSQLAYFFSAFSGVLPQGYTYSASVFARRGFYEMVAVCFINTALLSAVAALTKKQNGKAPVAIKALSLFIVMFSMLLLVIAAAKMGLNISAFGLSKNRLFVCLLMAAFAVVLIFFAIHLLAPKVPYMQPVIIICSAIFIAFAYFNSDNAIVKYNIAKYESGAISSIDGYYLSNLKGAFVSDFAEIEKSGNNSAANGARSAIIGRICECCPEFFGGGFAVNNDIEYKKSDFREYNLLGDQVKKDAAVFYNSLSEKERRTLYSQYLLEERGGTYDPDSNSYNVWENDGNEAVYSYDSATGEYIKSQSVHAAVYESNGYDDDNYGNERENESGSYLYVSKIK